MHKIEVILSPKNYSKRPTEEISCLVIHHTASFNIEGTIQWFKTFKYKLDDETKTNYSSAHYIIGLDGRIVQMVRDEDKAWHAGYSYFEGFFQVNNFSIGIELVGNGNKKKYTKEQYNALIWLTKELMKKYPKITIDRIVGHNEVRGAYIEETGRSVAAKIDPGKYFDWKKYRKGLELESRKVLKVPEKKPAKSVTKPPQAWYTSLLKMLFELFRKWYSR